MRYIFWIIFSLSMLSACQHTTTLDKNNKNNRNTHQKVSEEKDSAPLGPIPSFFRRVIPRAEPLSRYGNPAHYHVHGKTYNVLSNARGYKSKGLASWYGTKFHRRRTSSGESYDMYALTAAHRTLPLPTYVRVKNLDNGKQAIVKVNDRGPFHSDRILDLSYGAAVKLGVYPRGTAHVEIEALKVNPPGKSYPAHHYYLQAGAFTSKQLANNFRYKLQKLSRNKVVVEQYNKRFIVRVGPFNNAKDTAQLKNQLAKQGVKGTFSVLG